MKQLEIDSPCIGVCCLDDNNICLGCYRNILEIKNWSILTDQQKQAVLDRIDSLQVR